MGALIFLRFAWPYLLAAAIGVSCGWYGYGKGAAHTQAKWDKERAAQVLLVEQSRKKAEETEHNTAVTLKRQQEKFDAEVIARGAALASNNRELARLRDALSRAGRLSDPQAGPAGRPADGTYTLAAELLGACAGELVTLGDEARQLASKVDGLQRYAKMVLELYGR